MMAHMLHMITFGKVKNPCEDCWDGHCTMNCSGREPAESNDKGSAFITREKNGTVTIRVRSPDAYGESAINIPWDDWVSLREIGCAPR